MLRIYSIFRTTVAWLVLAILAALIGDYFIKLGERNHLYEATNAALAAAMTWIDTIRTQVWFWPSFLCLAGLATGMWFDTFVRRRAARRSGEFIPKGAMIFINEIEFNIERLSQPSPWLELYLTFSNATGYGARPFNVTGRVTVSGQEFHAHIEFVDTLKSHGSESFFRLGLKIPVSTSQAQYCLDCIQRRDLSVDFSEAIITFGITIYGRHGPTPELNVFLPKRVNFNADSLRTDPYLPWKSILR